MRDAFPAAPSKKTMVTGRDSLAGARAGGSAPRWPVRRRQIAGKVGGWSTGRDCSRAGEHEDLPRGSSKKSMVHRKGLVRGWGAGEREALPCGLSQERHGAPEGTRSRGGKGGREREFQPTLDRKGEMVHRKGLEPLTF